MKVKVTVVEHLVRKQGDRLILEIPRALSKEIMESDVDLVLITRKRNGAKN